MERLRAVMRDAKYNRQASLKRIAIVAKHRGYIESELFDELERFDFTIEDSKEVIRNFENLTNIERKFLI